MNINPKRIEEPEKVYEIQKINNADRSRISDLLIEQWGSTQVVSRGHLHHTEELPGFKVVIGQEIAGLITYDIVNNECEIVTLNSLRGEIGIGSALVEAVQLTAKNNHCQRLWVITTNDNIQAIHFYQKRGFVICAVYPDVIKEYRKLKPSIPLIGIGGIPIRDEIEFEIFI